MLRKKVDTLTDEVEAKDLKLQFMQGFLDECTKFRNEEAELLEAGTETKANVPGISGLCIEVSLVKETVA